VPSPASQLDVRLPALTKLHDLRERQDTETRRLVMEAVSEGASSGEIAQALGVSRSTLWRRYPVELRRGGRRAG
jgi:transposase-like protein